MPVGSFKRSLNTKHLPSIRLKQASRRSQPRRLSQQHRLQTRNGSQSYSRSLTPQFSTRRKTRSNSHQHNHSPRTHPITDTSKNHKSRAMLSVSALTTQMTSQIWKTMWFRVTNSTRTTWESWIVSLNAFLRKARSQVVWAMQLVVSIPLRVKFFPKRAASKLIVVTANAAVMRMANGA